MIVGIVIGSGIFFKSDDMLGYTNGNVGLAVLVFCIAAFTIVFGCLSFSQLAALTDKPGGVITYANEFVGKRWASMFGWFQVFIYYPTLTVLISWVVGIYVSLTMGWEMDFWRFCVIGLIWFFICFGYNILSAKIGGIFQEASVIIKLIPLFAIAIGGLVLGIPSLRFSILLQKRFSNEDHWLGSCNRTHRVLLRWLGCFHAVALR